MSLNVREGYLELENVNVREARSQSNTYWKAWRVWATSASRTGFTSRSTSCPIFYIPVLRKLVAPCLFLEISKYNFLCMHLCAPQNILDFPKL